MNSGLLAELLRVARAAAAVINAVYDTPFEVAYKGRDDPITAADQRANELICERLGSAFPGVPIVAEESAPASFVGYRESPQVFFVDPLDGTREFVKRNGEFAVMIGLLDHDRPLAGLILAPTTGVAWAGVVAQGAWRIAADNSEQSIQVRHVAVPSQARILISRSHRTELSQRAAAVLQVGEVRPLGSAGLKAATVAEGNADGYVGPRGTGKRWDACAAEALVTAAGGTLTDAFGDPIDYRDECLANELGVVASNRHLQSHLLERLAEARKLYPMV